MCLVEEQLVFLMMFFCFPDRGGDISWLVIRDFLQQLPDVHHNLLRYLCNFLTLVDKNHEENRMTAQNLATVFGPSVFQ